MSKMIERDDGKPISVSRVKGAGPTIAYLYIAHLSGMIRFFSLFFIFFQTVLYAQIDSVVQASSSPIAPVSIGTLRILDGVSLIKEKTYSITITVTNIRNKNGVIRFKFYDDTTPFPDKNGFLKVVVPKSEFTGNTFTRTYHGFVSRNMAIALLDDENNNVLLDMGWFLPKEGHAFSDYYHTALRRPVYKDFDFVLTGDKMVVMKMKYY